MRIEAGKEIEPVTTNSDRNKPVPTASELDAIVVAMNQKFAESQVSSDTTEVVNTLVDKNQREDRFSDLRSDGTGSEVAPANAKVYSHYFKKLPPGTTHVDVYRVIKLFDVPAGPLDHALKKILCTGKRGAKDFRQDLIEIRDAVLRAIEMLDEDDREADE